MKKIFIVFLVCVMTITFSACGKKAEENTGLNGIDYTGEKLQQEITESKAYSEGLAFVKCENYRENVIYCIDKEGKVVFQSSDFFIDGTDQGVGFHNGLTLVTTKNKEPAICDTKGNLYTAKDLDADKILTTPKEVLEIWGHLTIKKAFYDGYIFLQKTTKSYNGNVSEISIIDSKFNTIVPYTTALSGVLAPAGVEYYHNGYIFFDKERVFDIKNASFVDDYKAINFDKANLEVQEKNDGLYYEIIDERICSLRQYNTLKSVEQINGLFLCGFETNDQADWVGILNSDGTLRFDPIYVGYGDYQFNGQILLVSSSDGTNKRTTTYDINGNKLGELAGYHNAELSQDENIIVIHNSEPPYFTQELTPLF